ncbi:hypothetical protein HY78_14625 [Rhizorhabdus wittichii DC-6]|nr:hypothetical protein HY78_14625 [Rhizorhabdus wittichii DC-6]
MIEIVIAAAVALTAAPELPDVTTEAASLAGVDISDRTFNDQVYRMCGANSVCQDDQRSGRLRFLQFYPEASDNDRRRMVAELSASIMPSGIINWARADQMLGLAQLRTAEAFPDARKAGGRRGVYCTSKISKSGRKASTSCF